jgi:hypothetical protein
VPDPPLGVGVGFRGPWRASQHGDAGAGEHGIEAGGELGVTVADQEPKAVDLLLKGEHEIAGLPVVRCARSSLPADRPRVRDRVELGDRADGQGGSTRTAGPGSMSEISAGPRQEDQKFPDDVPDSAI